MVELGYEYPHLQLTLPDPADDRRVFRIDFSWRDATGRLIFGELDGDDKYLRAEAGPVGKLLDERKREALLTVYRPSIARFSMAVARDPQQLSDLLDLHGVPRGPVPKLCFGDVPGATRGLCRAQDHPRPGHRDRGRREIPLCGGGGDGGVARGTEAPFDVHRAQTTTKRARRTSKAVV